MTEAQRYVDAFNAGDIGALGRVMAPTYRYTDRYAGGTVDAEAHLATVRAVLERVPDRRIMVARILEVGGTQVLEGTWRGSPLGGATSMGTHLVMVIAVAGGLITTATTYYQEADLIEM